MNRTEKVPLSIAVHTLGGFSNKFAFPLDLASRPGSCSAVNVRRSAVQSVQKPW
jgi:hypothetical protein